MKITKHWKKSFKHNYLLQDSRTETKRIDIENLELKNNFKHHKEDVGHESLKEGNNSMQFIAGITGKFFYF